MTVDALKSWLAGDTTKPLAQNVPPAEARPAKPSPAQRERARSASRIRAVSDESGARVRIDFPDAMHARLFDAAAGPLTNRQAAELYAWARENDMEIARAASRADQRAEVEALAADYREMILDPAHGAARRRGWIEAPDLMSTDRAAAVTRARTDAGRASRAGELAARLPIARAAARRIGLAMSDPELREALIDAGTDGNIDDAVIAVAERNAIAAEEAFEHDQPAAEQPAPEDRPDAARVAPEAGGPAAAPGAPAEAERADAGGAAAPREQRGRDRAAPEPQQAVEPSGAAPAPAEPPKPPTVRQAVQALQDGQAVRFDGVTAEVRPDPRGRGFYWSFDEGGTGGAAEGNSVETRERAIADLMDQHLRAAIARGGRRKRGATPQIGPGFDKETGMPAGKPGLAEPPATTVLFQAEPSGIPTRQQNIERGRRGMEQVLTHQKSVRDVMYRKEIGWISFVWGDESAGIDHLISQRMAAGMSEERATALARRVVDVIANGTFGPYYLTYQGGNIRRNLIWGNQSVVLSPVRAGKRLTWIVTSFEGGKRAPEQAKLLKPDEAEKAIAREVSAGATDRAVGSSRVATQPGHQPVLRDPQKRTPGGTAGGPRRSESRPDLGAAKENVGQEPQPDKPGEDTASMLQAAPALYSALTRAVEALPTGTAPPAQWANTIRNLVNKGVKQAEIDWSGVIDWLSEQKGRVTRAGLLSYLRTNEVRVEETTHLGGEQFVIIDTSSGERLEETSRPAGTRPMQSKPSSKNKRRVSGPRARRMTAGRCCSTATSRWNSTIGTRPCRRSTTKSKTTSARTISRSRSRPRWTAQNSSNTRCPAARTIANCC